MFTGLLLTIFTVVQLNCENMFDCTHDSLKEDYEFLPSSARHYSAHKYWDKLNRISKDIVWCGCDADDFHLPDIVTLCEVENDSVLSCLTERSSLRTARYRYVMTSSPDERGIDVAILYNPNTFMPLHHHAVRVPPVEGMRPTRDILFVSGVTAGGDTLNIFAVHLPSKYGGEKRTAPFRRHAARCLCAAVDSLRSVCPGAKVIVTGDFNDDAASEALSMVCGHDMVNVSACAGGEHGAGATYKYRGLWRSIDHILISPSLSSSFRGCVVKDAPFLLERDKKYGGCKPRRFWNGYRLNGGYSDHLPLLAVFEM